MFYDIQFVDGVDVKHVCLNIDDFLELSRLDICEPIDDVSILRTGRFLNFKDIGIWVSRSSVSGFIRFAKCKPLSSTDDEIWTHNIAVSDDIQNIEHYLKLRSFW